MKRADFIDYAAMAVIMFGVFGIAAVLSNLVADGDIWTFWIPLGIGAFVAGRLYKKLSAPINQRLNRAASA
ncbi:hypothetical protein [Tsukamurella sp. 1534]|uniref:hypothetical protein n=1 Tax=Tsukamurella sp. 1534 TaxID=1151061 RepID=UPI000300B196|nr:hypothetical protein [Tsukamurella sp. 1534]